jgi:hypothetical protein
LLHDAVARRAARPDIRVSVSHAAGTPDSTFCPGFSLGTTLASQLLTSTAMKRADATLSFPCGADWNAMTRIDDRARLCDACATVVTDLSAMDEAEARAALTANRGRLCVRYLYDPHTEEIAFKGSSFLPASGLVRNVKRVAATAAALVAPMLVQACGGVGAYEDPSRHDPLGDASREPAEPTVDQTATDGGADGAAKHDADAGAGNDAK